MKVLFDYLQTEKSGILSYRRKFPIELVRHIPSRSPNGGGRRELKVSLRSRSINDPQARARYAEAERDFEAIVSRARRWASQSFDPLDEPLLRFLVDTYLHDHQEADETMRWRGKQRRPLYETRGRPEEVYLDCREMLEGYESYGLVSYWKDWACGYADALGFHIDPADPEFPSFCRALGEAACTLWLTVDERIDGKTVETLPAPTGHSNSAAKAKLKTPTSVSGMSLMTLYEKYSAVPGRNPKTVAQWRPYVAHLAKFSGVEDVSAMTHDHIVAWRNHLRDEMSYRGNRLSEKTINGSYLGAVNAMFAWARGDNIISHNPALEVTPVKLPAKPRLRTKSFNAQEVETILRATLVPPVSREGEHLRNAKRWCPWLMAYSGARVNEITQLRREDIFEQEGVWVMRITPEAGTVKTKTYRLVPLHSHLRDQGFLDFVESRPQGPLFYDPAKRRSDNAINRQSNRLGSKLAAWVHSLGIEGVKPNHAWRHLFTNLAVRHGLELAVAKAITGHASSDVQEKVYLEDLKDAVDLLSRELEKMPRFLSG